MGERGHYIYIADDADPVCVCIGNSFLSVLYLVNQWVDFDQTCMGRHIHVLLGPK